MLRHRVNHYTDEFDQSCPRVAVAVAVYCTIGTGRDNAQNGALNQLSDDRQFIQRCARSLRLKLSAIAIK